MTEHQVAPSSTGSSQRKVRRLMKQVIRYQTLVATLEPDKYKWFLPIDPAVKESIHEVAPASAVGSGFADRARSPYHNG